MLSLDTDGAEHFPRSISSVKLAALEELLGKPAEIRAGLRITDNPFLTRWLYDAGIVAIVSDQLGAPAKPVRAIFFDKTKDRNWSLDWHQDRTIAVSERRDCEGFGPWGEKAGIVHVAPPFSVIGRMVTARIHLDAVSFGNAPLRVACGSHRFGRIPEPDIPAIVAQCETVACLADAGDVWLYRTAILHASELATEDSRRRVLQVDFSADELPPPLQWRGVGATVG